MIRGSTIFKNVSTTKGGSGSTLPAVLDASVLRQEMHPSERRAYNRVGLPIGTVLKASGYELGTDVEHLGKSEPERHFSSTRETIPRFGYSMSLSRGPVVHDLKIMTEHFVEVRAGRKTAELRKDDRDFRIGDVLLLREWGPKKLYTGKEVRRPITCITRLRAWIPGVEEDWCVLHMGILK